MELFPAGDVPSRAEPARTESADLGDVESQFATLERDSAALATSANELHRISRRILSASKTGESKQIAKCVDQLRTLRLDLEKNLRNVMSFNDVHLRQCFNSDAYLLEIEQQAVRLGISGMRRANGMLLAQPHRLSRSGEAIKIGKRLLKGIRPSVIAMHLKNMRSRSKSIGNKWLAFLERLEKAYDLLATSRHGDTENLEKVYEVLTILPEARKLYSIDDFMADVYDWIYTGRISRHRSAKCLSQPARRPRGVKASALSG